MLDIEDANPFRIRAYRNAARTIRDHPKNMADLIAAGQDLSTLPGIGKDLAGRMMVPQAEEVADALTRYLARCEGIKRTTVAGSHRRRKETVGDLDIIVTASKRARVIDGVS